MSNEIELGSCVAGTVVRITGIDAGSGLESRLTGMGIRRGVELRIMRNDLTGPMVVSVDNGRVMLGRGMVGSILVEEA